MTVAGHEKDGHSQIRCWYHFTAHFTTPNLLPHLLPEVGRDWDFLVKLHERRENLKKNQCRRKRIARHVTHQEVKYVVN